MTHMGPKTCDFGLYAKYDAGILLAVTLFICKEKKKSGNS